MIDTTSDTATKPTTPPVVGSFQKRRIDVTFTLASGTFSDGSNSVTVSGLRVSAQIRKGDNVTQGELDLRIYGMTVSLMNSLSRVGLPPLEVQSAHPEQGAVQAGNAVIVTAGATAITPGKPDASTGMSICYAGVISEASIDYSGSPDVAFHVLAMAALDLALLKVPPNSYQGGADAATIMGNLARQCGLTLENSGVSGVMLSNAYFHGSPLAQIQDCAMAAGINFTIDRDRSVLAIWPRGSSRGGLIPLVSAATGMVGYPRKTALGVDVETIYNPAIVPGAAIQIRSSVPSCNGQWNVAHMDSTLESETPGGAWFSHLTCVVLGYLP